MINPSPVHGRFRMDPLCYLKFLIGTISFYQYHTFVWYIQTRHGFEGGQGMGRTPPGQTREKVFRFVRDRLASGRPPTVREVMEAFGFRSPQTAREHLEALLEAGRLKKEPGVARGLR